MDDDARQDLLARHNLQVTYGEIRTVRQAIRSGNLLELVDSRARGHPAMLDGYRTLLDHAEQLERTDPVSKDAFFYTSTESARRPEVVRHQQRLDRFDLDADEVLLTEGGSNSRYDETWGVLPPFGPYPRELADSYPLTAEVPERTDRAACEAAADGVARLVELHPEVAFTLVHDDWPETALARVPEGVRLRDLHARE